MPPLPPHLGQGGAPPSKSHTEPPRGPSSGLHYDMSVKRRNKPIGDMDDIWAGIVPDEEEPQSSLKPIDGAADKLIGGSISRAMVTSPSLNKVVVERGLSGRLVEKPHMDALLSTGYLIIFKQLEFILEKSQREELNSTETKQLESYLKLVRTLGMEERDQRIADGIASMSNEALKALVDGKDE